MKFRMKRKHIKDAALLALVCIIVVGGLFLLHHWEQQQGSPVSHTPTEPEAYVLRKDMETILVMGLDKYQSDEEAVGYLNDQQCDFLMLLVLDRKAGICDILQLNRDTMTEIQRLGLGGGAAGVFDGQLALAHTFGSGGSDSCLNTTRAVSKLLGSVPVQHYFAVTMDAIAEMNDLVGGVTVNIMDDFTHIDPSMVQGQNVTLNGQQAEQYVRGRASLEDKSNLHRMERQRQYLLALFNQLMVKKEEDSSFFSKVMTKLSPYFQTDYTINQLDQLAGDIENVELSPIRTIEGEAVEGEEFMEFYVDKNSLAHTILDLFYESQNND